MHTDITELARRLSNLIRLGTVAQIDPSAARIRIQTGPILTDWIPWLTFRAGTTRSWSAPSIGEQVMLISPSGDTAQAIALPALYANDSPAPSAGIPEHLIAYPDGAVISYNHSSGALTVTGIKTAHVNAIESITASAPAITANADVATVNASTTTVNASLIALNAPLTVVTGALEVTGGALISNGVSISGAASIEGSIDHNGVLISNGITFGSHVHANVTAGSDLSGGPQP